MKSFSRTRLVTGLPDQRELARERSPLGPALCLALSVATGFLLVLLFPAYDLGWLAWVAMIPLIVVVTTVRPRAAFAYGLVSGLIFFGGLLPWIATFGFAPWIALSLVMALYVGIFGAITSYVGARRHGMARVMLPAVVWTALEWLRSLFDWGFTWGSLGYSQAGFLPVLQLASLAGPYGISFLIMLVNGALADLLLIRMRAGGPSVPPLGAGPRSLWRLGAVAALVALSMLWGWRESIRADRPQPGERTVRVAIVQGNRIEERDVVWTYGLVRSVVRTYLELSREAAKRSPELIVWPETTVPAYLPEEPDILASISSLARQSGSALLVGGSRRDSTGRIYNTAFLFAPNGELVGQYSKVHLVPFGEFVPWRDRTDFFKRWPIRDFDYSPGPGYHPLRYRELRLGTAICFESIFPDIFRTLIREDANLLVITTNDGWYGRSAAAAQHARMAAFRAVETRRWVLRAALTGISQVISPSGRVVSQIPLFQQGILEEEITLRNDRTLYAHTGNWLAIICALLVLGLLVGRKFLKP